MSLSPWDQAHQLATIRSYIEATESELRECKDALGRARALEKDDATDNARKLLEAAQALKYWLGRRLRKG